jgi:two-component system, sensor histidine kinase YesM
MNIGKSTYNAIKRLFYNLRLRDKLFIMFLLVAILPLLVFGYYTQYTMKTELTNQTYAKMSATTAQINTNLESKLEAYTKISTILYLDNMLRYFLSHDYSGDYSLAVDAYQYFNNTINNILTTNPDIRSLTIYSNNNSLPLDGVFIQRLDNEFRQTLIYESLRHSYGNVRFLTRPSESGTPPMFTLTRWLNNYSLNYPYGALTINVLESTIFELMEKESKDKTVMIVDAQGSILSTKDKAMLNRNIAEFISNSFDGSREGRFDDTFLGEKVLVVYNTTKYGWKTISIIPYESFIAKAQAATTKIFTIVLISIGLAALLIYIAARLFTKRVEYLLQMIRRVEREDFNIAMPTLGQDEIGQLGLAFHNMAMQLNSLITEVYKKEIDKKEAEMNVLQAQINPHFLYNILASISSLAIRNGDQRINKMASELAKFYRISLSQGKSVLSIHEEIKLTQHYITIQQVRFDGLLRVYYDIDESVLPCPIVKLTLQPFVENCIHHAIWDDKLGINIIIKAYREGDDLILKVIDDGMGMKQTNTTALPEGDRKASGYGILNVDRRLKLMYGDAYGVTLYSRLGIGTTVEIRIPG